MRVAESESDQLPQCGCLAHGLFLGARGWGRGVGPFDLCGRARLVLVGGVLVGVRVLKLRCWRRMLVRLNTHDLPSRMLSRYGCSSVRNRSRS